MLFELKKGFYSNHSFKINLYKFNCVLLIHLDSRINVNVFIRYQLNRSF